MTNTEQTMFFVLCMTRYDLDSVEVDAILNHYGLNYFETSFKGCIEAIKHYTSEYTSWTPVGPITDMGPAGL
jgi:hypothetical protein